jgi:hypothetical protein
VRTAFSSRDEDDEERGPRRDGNGHRRKGESQVDLARRLLSQSWTARRTTADEIRNTMFTRWNRVFDVDLVDVEGTMHLALHMGDVQPADTAAYMQKLTDIATRLNAWSCVDVALYQIRCVRSPNPTLPGCRVMLPLNISDARSAEFNV